MPHLRLLAGYAEWKGADVETHMKEGDFVFSKKTGEWLRVRSVGRVMRLTRATWWERIVRKWRA